MKNKGFTLVELITTFALTAVILVLLINVIVIINNVYSKANIKTELYINQSNLSNVLNKKLNESNLISYASCSDTEFCYTFNFSDDESISLSITEQEIKFGNYVYKLMNKTTVGEPSITKRVTNDSDISKDNSVLIIKIPIICELYPDLDFGVNVVYSYNSNYKVL